jgi:hypothetical protein
MTSLTFKPVVVYDKLYISKPSNALWVEFWESSGIASYLLFTSWARDSLQQTQGHIVIPLWCQLNIDFVCGKNDTYVAKQMNRQASEILPILFVIPSMYFRMTLDAFWFFWIWGKICSLPWRWLSPGLGPPLPLLGKPSRATRKRVYRI